MMTLPMLLWRGRLVLGTAAVVALGLPTTAASAAPSRAAVANDTLTVNGTNASERIALRLAAGSAGTLEVDFGDDGSAEHSFDRNAFSNIVVTLRNGSDEFRVDQVNGAFADEALTIDGGNGNDTLNGGDGNELYDGGRGNDFVDGNKGADTAHLGSGSDSFRWDPGDGSDVVEGNSGPDTLDFNGAGVKENMSLSPNGERSLFLRDAGNIRMDMDGVERLDLTTLGDIDTVTINDMSGTDFERADIDLSGPVGGGDAAADVVTVNGTANADHVSVEAQADRVVVAGLKTETRIAGSETTDLLKVNTAEADDNVVVDAEVLARIGTSFDLGADES